MDREPSPTTSHAERGERFRRLHDGPGALVLPNPWDAGTARLLAALGFEALATTSAGQAFAAGHPDGATRRADMLDHVALIADLEDGYGLEPAAVARTITEAAERGAVGGSIEDLNRARQDEGLIDRGRATERIAAAAEAARALAAPFTLTARCEGYLPGFTDLAQTIERLQAYQAAGADVLYAPGLTRRVDIEAATSSLDRPLNVVMGLSGEAHTLAELEAMGVRRVSLGSTLARVAFGAFLRAAEALRQGRFDVAGEAVPYARLNQLLAGTG
jgi:2-methylisocitrate lyase-like PEP mutase family enzyme